MSPALPAKLAKALRGECERCRLPAIPGSAWCATHGDIERSQGAARQANRRDRLRAEKRCLDCAVELKSRGLVRCPTCREKNAASQARVTDRGPHVTETRADPSPRGHYKLEADSRNASWASSARYVGRARRGAPSREDRDRDLAMDLDDAIAELTAVRDQGIAELRSARITELGRIAKREAHALVADRLLRAARYAEGVAEALCPGRVAEVRAEMGE